MIRSHLLAMALLLSPHVTTAAATKADFERAESLAKRFENKVARERIDLKWIDPTHAWYGVDTGMKREFVFVDVEAQIKTPLFDVTAAKLGDATFDVLGVQDGRVVVLVSDRDVPLAVDRATGATTELSADELSKYATPLRSERMTSSGGDAETSLLFLNRSEADVELFWVDAGGNEKSYGTLAPKGQRSQHTFAGHAWQIRTKAGDVLGYARGERRPTMVIITEAPATAPIEPQRDRPTRDKSADGRFQAIARDHNLFLRDLNTQQEKQLTTDGTAESFYELTDFQGDQTGFSPDGKRFVALKTQAGKPRTLTLIESSPKDQLQPRLRERHYDKPGDVLPVSKPVMFDVDSFAPIEIEDALFPNAWSVDRFFWWPDGRFSFLYNQRGHQVLRVLSVSPAGRVTSTVDEASQTFIDYSSGTYLKYLQGTNEILWQSERDGWKNLYLIDVQTGKVKRRLNGDYVVRGVEHLDEAARELTFRAGGIHDAQDPYYVHFARVNLDTGATTLLTQADGTHDVDFSPDRAYYVDRWSRVDRPPVHELRRASDGSLVMELERADDGALKSAGWQTPQRFVAKGRDGTTDIYGVIFRPSHFDPAKKYPVLENLYAGPQSAFTPKAFRSFFGHMQAAEMGFIVVQLDGMGTNWRSKAFHDVAYKNLKDAGFPDRIAWIRAAAKEVPQMDLDRVGVYGGSAGGQNAMRAVLDHADFYKAAFADCGCHDNRMDKIWWNEQWMGWPVDQSYVDSSNAVDAHKLGGALMLSVGMMDENVDPSSTMQVVQALIDADKDFDLLVFPRGGHGAGGSAYGKRRMFEFFVKHLQATR